MIGCLCPLVQSIVRNRTPVEGLAEESSGLIEGENLLEISGLPRTIVRKPWRKPANNELLNQILGGALGGAEQRILKGESHSITAACRVVEI